MNPHLVMGIFALYVVIVSLVRLMADREFPRLTAMKRIWGRRRGLVMHFVSNVALPLVFGIVFLSRGVTGIGGADLPCDPALQQLLHRYSVSVEAVTVPMAQLVAGLSDPYGCDVAETDRPQSDPVDYADLGFSTEHLMP